MIKTRMTKNIKCQFCGKELEQRQIVFKVGENEVLIDGEPEKCDCKESKMYWKKIQYKKEMEKKKKEEFRKSEEIKRLYKFSKMNLRLKEYSFKNYRTTKNNIDAFMKVKNYTENFLKGTERGSLFITGGVGTGKTHLASSVANELIQNEIPVVFGTLINLLTDIKDSYGTDGEKEGYIIQKYSKVKMLIIDDLGKERPSEWVLEKLFTIINNRYENNLPVIITTNYNRDKLRERLANNKNYEIADSIISRLYEMCRGIALTGNDIRKELV